MQKPELREKAKMVLAAWLYQGREGAGVQGPLIITYSELRNSSLPGWR